MPPAAVLKLHNPARSPLGRLLLDFLDHLEIEKGRSLLTRRNYEIYLSRFLQYVEKSRAKPVAKDITYEEVRQFRLWLHRLEDARGENLGAASQNYHLIALRSFLKYLAKRDILSLPAEKVELAKIPERHVSFLSGEELERFLAAPFSFAQSELLATRDKAILETLFSTGLRVSELISLQRDTTNLDKGEVGVLGKGKKRRVVFISPEAKNWTKKYLALRRDVSPWLFANHDRAAREREKNRDREHKNFAGLTARSIQRLVEKYAIAAGITKTVTPHVMRHSFATDLLRNGADIRSVQAMLGHASITTTQVYTHVTDPQLKKVHQQFHHRSK